MNLRGTCRREYVPGTKGRWRSSTVESRFSPSKATRRLCPPKPTGRSTILFDAVMKIQQRIPVFFRVPMALLAHAAVAFAPMIGLLVYRPFKASPWILIGLGAAWILVFDRFLMWRLDCFWNVRCMQNRTGKPPNPDNYREFKTAKGWMGWLFLGKDYENKKPNNASNRTAGTRSG